jgi:iron complex transport system substrate-binding protein
LTEEIFLLGRGPDLIADTIYCIYPDEAKRKEKIGNMLDINLEKIYSLKPDLILASGLTEKEQLEKLRGMKLNVEIFTQPESFNEICLQFLRLSMFLDREIKAREIIAHARYQVSNIMEITSHFPKKRVFVQIGANPLFTASSNSFINDFIVYSGGINIGEDSGIGIYSVEMVLKEDPEVIIISDMGNSVENEINYWKEYKSMTAVKRNALFGIDSYRLCSPTPVSFVRTLEDIIHMVHPEYERDVK